MAVVTQSDTKHIGQTLKAQRKERELSLAYISEHLRIKESYLDAIETLDTQALPPIGYVLGYVRAYATYLGLDPLHCVSAYKTDTKTPEDLARRNQPHFVHKRQIRMPKGFFAASTVLSAAAVLGFWYASQTPAQSTIVPGLEPVSNVEIISERTLPAGPDILTIKAVAPSWVQIHDAKGKLLVSRIFVKGESWQTPLSAKARLTARDGGALELYVGQELAGRVGAVGTPVSNIIIRAPQTSEASESSETFEENQSSDQ